MPISLSVIIYNFSPLFCYVFPFTVLALKIVYMFTNTNVLVSFSFFESLFVKKTSATSSTFFVYFGYFIVVILIFRFSRLVFSVFRSAYGIRLRRDRKVRTPWGDRHVLGASCRLRQEVVPSAWDKPVLLRRCGEIRCLASETQTCADGSLYFNRHVRNSGVHPKNVNFIGFFQCLFSLIGCVQL